MRRTILDFTGIYRNQETLRAEAQEYLDLSRMQGTDCYCDPETEKKLREMLRKVPEGGIHLMDSGNYHYMSRLFLEACQHRVSLVMMDHHTDMQPSALLPVLSCGSWLLDTLLEVSDVQEVFLIGPPQKALEQIPCGQREKIFMISREELEAGAWKEKLMSFVPHFPVYYSIDKDILSPDVCQTNWDQGTMKLCELKEILRWFLEKYPIAGADLCGEPQAQGVREKEIVQSMQVNKEIIGLFSERDPVF